MNIVEEYIASTKLMGLEVAIQNRGGNITLIRVSDKAVDFIVPDFISIIDSYAFYDCTKLRTLTIGRGIKSLGSNTFEGLRLIESVNILGEDTELGFDLFKGCTSLKKVNLPKRLKILESNTFEGCVALEEIKLPDSLEKIRKEAFTDCVSLKRLNMPKGVRLMSFNTFDGAFESESVYEYVDGWCLRAVSIDPGEQLITIEDGTKKLDNGAFKDMVSLEKVELPNTLEWMGESTFCGCTKLKSVNIPENVEELPERAFKDCESLESIEIPSNVKVIGRSAFVGCNRLSEVKLNEGLGGIYKHAFIKCSELRHLEIPNSVRFIAEDAFVLCRKLVSITIPRGVVNLGYKTFAHTNTNLVIRCHKNSDAHKLAKTTGLKYELMN